MAYASATGSGHLMRARVGELVFVIVIAALFAASVAVTIVWCASMSKMGAMPMPGGWTMSTAWRPMCGQTWARAAASFVGMWAVMMVAMMLPSFAPVWWRYRRAVRGTGEAGGAGRAGRVGLAGELRAGGLSALMGIGYFFVWAVSGCAAFALGAALTALEMRRPVLARGVPLAIGLVVLSGGALQFSGWKARRLACCRKAPTCAQTQPVDARSAWRHGVSVGLHCSYCCAGFTAILLASGVMDLPVMAAVTAAITAERVAPDGARVAHAIGVVVLGVGALLIAQALGFA
ncbi:DUF2182 domain-containing protein [Paraburkholderia bryophila]|uniref:Putative metal-binding membrane protein n=1 Tax=Paraburkholderia bryophila TaxID=420952 RepID=A0A7Z0B9P2_9BURK|nr:DUF2182 domain-containing protein [Paraburkholderia bryophila]NYH25473.1 putative metal-binding membrane protein [Paraburkholderia bryophila]